MSFGSEITWLLEITWHDTVYRFSTIPIILTDTVKNEDLQFIGTMNTPEFTLSSNFFGINLEASTIPFEIIFESMDLVQERFQGRVLDNQKGVLSYIETPKGMKTTPIYQDKILVFTGRISQPIIGDIQKPIGHVQFSLEQGTEIDNFYIEGTNLKIPTSNEATQGKNFPLVIGFPGKNIRYINNLGDMTQSDFSPTPAYLIQNTGGLTANCIISYGIVDAQYVLMEDSEGNSEMGVPVLQDNIPNTAKVYSYVNINGTALTVSNDADMKYYVSWQYSGGGIVNPYGEGALEGGCDVIRWILERGNIDIDFQNFDSIAPFLNAFKFAGYINTPAQGIEFLESQIMPFLPAELTYGKKGVKIIIPLLYSNLYNTPQQHIIENADFRFTSGLTSQESPAEIVNAIEFQFAFSVMTEQHLSSISINPTLEEEATATIKTTYSDISFNRYGLKRDVIQANFIHDFSTAVRAAQQIIRRHALGIMTITARASISFGHLEIGDVIQITSPDFHLENHNAQIIEKSYFDNAWVFTIAIEDNPVQNN